MKKRMNKRGDTIVLETTIFVILNLVFFTIMLMFAYTSGNRELVFEQTYAKEIALIIDNAKPEMALLLDVSELVEIAKENRKDLKEIVKLDKEENRVFVSLRGNRGYSYKYFTNAEVNLKLEGNDLVIGISKKIENNEVEENE